MSAGHLFCVCFTQPATETNKTSIKRAFLLTEERREWVKTKCTIKMPTEYVKHFVAKPDVTKAKKQRVEYEMSTDRGIQP